MRTGAGPSIRSYPGVRRAAERSLTEISRDDRMAGTPPNGALDCVRHSGPVSRQLRSHRPHFRGASSDWWILGNRNIRRRGWAVAAASSWSHRARLCGRVLGTNNGCAAKDVQGWSPLVATTEPQARIVSQWAERVRRVPNDEMHRTSHGPDGGSPLISVLGALGPRLSLHQPSKSHTHASSDRHHLDDENTSPAATPPRLRSR